MTGFGLDKNPQAHRFFGLVSCGMAKKKVACKARNLYTSPFVKLSAEWMERNCSQWAILSAKHGLLPPDKVTEPYDTYLPDLSDKDRKDWAVLVRRQLHDEKRTILFAGGKFYVESINEGFKRPVEIINIFERLGIGNRGLRAQWFKKNPLLTPAIMKELGIGKS